MVGCGYCQDKGRLQFFGMKKIQENILLLFEENKGKITGSVWVSRSQNDSGCLTGGSSGKGN
jgi:hypothetical protein